MHFKQAVKEHDKKASVKRSSAMRILIVEDEERLAQAVSAILAKEKYTVDAVYNGLDGYDYAMSGVYDVIILDIMLPKMNGLDVLKKLRNEKISTPVLLLTAKDDVADKVKGLDSGADDYLTKPFATEELLARIRAMSRRKGELLDELPSFEDIAINTKTSELLCGVNAVKLALKELLIMELLITNGRQIITKEQFIEKIWGFEADAEYNNVEVYISFLRKKLTHIHSNVEIKTSRGIGYSLEYK